MEIHGLTVCVNYSDLLKQSIRRWKEATDSLVVVTNLTDAETLSLCAEHELWIHQTDVFTKNGAHFNKGHAISESFSSFYRDSKTDTDDWYLFFDADVIPPTDLRARIEMCEPIPGHLYGANRHREDGHRIPDPYPAGYFLLFNSQDINASAHPIVDTHWTHAGNYDSTFINRWTRDKIHFMPIPLRHIGNPGENWCGRGNTKAMNELLAERRRRRDWRHERISDA